LQYLKIFFFLQRWLPIEGFSGRLLPTDRFHYSSQDGTCDRSLDKIRLPSMAWQWEGDWHLETTLDGLPLDHDVSFLCMCQRMILVLKCYSH
jgi:hypothetical protein